MEIHAAAARRHDWRPLATPLHWTRTERKPGGRVRDVASAESEGIGGARTRGAGGGARGAARALETGLTVMKRIEGFEGFEGFERFDGFGGFDGFQSFQRFGEPVTEPFESPKPRPQNSSNVSNPSNL